MENNNKTPIEKPDCPLLGADSNIFNLVGIAKRVLEKSGMNAEAEKMQREVFKSSSYEEALSKITDYVNPVEVENKGQNMSF